MASEGELPQELHCNGGVNAIPFNKFFLALRFFRRWLPLNIILHFKYITLQQIGTFDNVENRGFTSRPFLFKWND